MNYYEHLTEEDYKREIWKDIEGYEDLYQVSNLGRVKSLKNDKERILKPEKRQGGYLQIHLYKDGKPKMYKVHRLVATAFIQRTSLFDTDVNHKEEFAKWDNRVENLEFCDRSYNINYGSRNKRAAKSKSKPVVGVSIKDGSIIEFTSITGAEKQGFNQGNICSCIKGRLKAYKGYIWRYA